MENNILRDTLHVQFKNLDFSIDFTVSSELGEKVEAIKITNFSSLELLFQEEQKTKQKLSIPATLYPKEWIPFPSNIHTLDSIIESYGLRTAVLIRTNTDIHPILQSIIDNNALYHKRWPKQIHVGMIRKANSALLTILGDKFSVVLKRDVFMEYSNNIFAKNKSKYECTWSSILSKPRFYCNKCGGNSDYTSQGYCGH